MAKPTSGLSSQQRLLEQELKLANGANGASEGELEVLNGLEEWIPVGTIWRTHTSTEANADNVQSSAQPLHQMINRLQGQRWFDPVKDRSDRGAR